MEIVCISDTHGLHREVSVPDGDMLIHAGDCTHGFGDRLDLGDFNDWLGELPHRHKILIAGNHDWIFQRKPEEARKTITNAVYLQDEAVELEGLKVYGSPWQPEFFDWAFNLPRGEALREVWAKIPDDTQILVTHGPPKGIRDALPDGAMVGCEELAARVRQLSQLRLHVFGHIHCAYGKAGVLGEREFVNAAICSEAYKPVHRPIVVEISNC